MIDNIYYYYFAKAFTFSFNPGVSKEREVLLELWDYDTFSDNDLIGRLNVPV